MSNPYYRAAKASSGPRLLWPTRPPRIRRPTRADVARLARAFQATVSCASNGASRGLGTGRTYKEMPYGPIVRESA